MYGRTEKSSDDATRTGQAGGMSNETEDGVVLRPSVEADVEDWLDLLSAVASEGLWIGTEAPIDREARRARFLQQLDAEGAASFVAVADGRLVGSLSVVMCHGIDAGVGDLGMLVAADSRGRGVGSALMEAGLGWARTAGAHKVALTLWPHNHAARALYAKFGFLTEGALRRTVRRRNGELWDAVTMGLVLDTTSPGHQAAGAMGAGGACQPRPSLDLPEGGLRHHGLLLRPGRLADAGALAAAIDEPEVHRWLDFLPDPYTRDDAQAFLADARQQWAGGTGTPFLITNGGELVGGIGLSLETKDPCLGEVGYWVARPARGRGVATAALTVVVDWAFGVVGLRRVQLHAAVDNRASRAVAEHAGFEQEGVNRWWRTVHGTPTDFLVYARVAERCS